ncbi:MAG TPA: GNAT family N-acetyltransferase [Steroidobacteraceae bacterium]|jgi:ribosomal protein S18 acetylase RimI-like enzyme
MSAALRRAGADDAPSLAVIAERTFRDAFGAHNSPDNMDLQCARHFGPDIQAREIADPGLVTTLALEGGQIVGFTQVTLAKAHASVPAKRAAELNRIYVVAEQQGKGVAQALMQGALATAAAAGADRLWLGVWEHNPRAIAFYRKFGFEIVGEHTFMLGQERQRDILMAARIA